MMDNKKDKYIHVKNLFVWFGILPICTVSYVGT